ncbi:NADPH-dependent FMN reductase [Bacillus sp. AGMB 02131]|uniref:NADPH-dependent FMN reductase n=1 Tax=Peribacillus faecalis TaxID=2772559 RepID=A0A927CW38_9BACI|nr:NADPH-dependent FMN reductase [Peribacillus faecalis]MBD3108703.1 NADPH-dependent FMN reductase [Peribacillus faecalis]
MSTVIINGANAKQSRVTGVEQFVGQFLKKNNVETDVITVHELPAEDLITANYASEAIKNVNRLVEKADTVIVLTPIYKAAYSGILKTYLDLLPQKALENKFIIPVAVGGSLNHLLAVNYALKPLLSELGATEIAKSVYILDKQISKHEDGSFSFEDEVEERLITELKPVLKRQTQKV